MAGLFAIRRGTPDDNGGHACRRPATMSGLVGQRPCHPRTHGDEGDDRRRAHGVGAGSRERSGARGGTKDGLAPGPRGGRRRAKGPGIRGRVRGSGTSRTRSGRSARDATRSGADRHLMRSLMTGSGTGRHGSPDPSDMPLTGTSRRRTGPGRPASPAHGPMTKSLAGVVTKSLADDDDGETGLDSIERCLYHRQSHEEHPQCPMCPCRSRGQCGARGRSGQGPATD